MHRLYIRVKRALCTLAVALLALGLAPNAQAVSVDVELSLLIDVSASITIQEFDLQMRGYSEAFRDASVINAITDTSNGRFGAVAVEVVFWGGVTQQRVGHEWYLIDSEAKSGVFASRISFATRPSGWLTATTAPGGAIEFATTRFDDNGYESTRQVIDVSGDGKQNSPDDPDHTANARDAALAAGVDVINGLVITNTTTEDGVLAWYDANVIGGNGAFVLESTSFYDIGPVIANKISTEIGSPRGNPGGPGSPPMPEPAAALLFGAGALIVFRAIRPKSA